MAGDKFEGIFGFLEHFIANRSPSVVDTRPTVSDLEREVSQIWKSPRTQGELGENSAPPMATESKASSIPSGCVPCSIGHLGTCSGLLNEAIRFARNDGIENDEVINRVNMCLDELNTMERVDLRPEMIQDLSDWEKDLANKALGLSRSLRHNLEGLANFEGLEQTAAQTQSMRQEIGRGWFKEKLSRMSPEQRQVLEQRLKEKYGEPENQG